MKSSPANLIALGPATLPNPRLQVREPHPQLTALELAEEFDDARWVKAKSLAALLDVSRDTIERRAVAWQETPVPHRFRYKWLQLDAATPPERRYFLRDAEQCLFDPTRPRNAAKGSALS